MYEALPLRSNVRVGREHNIFYAPKQFAILNLEFVERPKRIVAKM
jgi:uncharacterized protein (DUF849 family)